MGTSHIHPKARRVTPCTVFTECFHVGLIFQNAVITAVGFFNQVRCGPSKAVRGGYIAHSVAWAPSAVSRKEHRILVLGVLHVPQPVRSAAPLLPQRLRVGHHTHFGAALLALADCRFGLGTWYYCRRHTPICAMPLYFTTPCQLARMPVTPLIMCYVCGVAEQCSLSSGAIACRSDSGS